MTAIIRIFIGVIVLAAFTAPGCTPESRTSKARRATKSEPYDFKTEGTIPANDREAVEEADVVEVPVSEDAIEVEEAEAPLDTTPPEATPQAVHIDGYRVQVFATASRDVAEGARRTAEARTRESAYVEFVDGLYKVRVGNCRTRADAEKLLERIQSGFYKDAWIVETRIEVPQGSAGTGG